MPEYKVKTPDGGVVTVNAPEGATPEQAIEFVAKTWKPKATAYQDARSQTTTKQVEQPKQKTSEDFFREELQKGDWLTRNLAGAGGAMVGGWEGLKGLVGKSDPEQVRMTKIAQEEAPVGSVVGNVAMFAPTMAIPGVNTAAGAGAAGGIFNALTTPGGIADRAKAAGYGAVGGTLGQGVSNALGKLFQRSAPEAVNALTNEGIYLTPGQYAGGVWKELEDKMAHQIPILGGIINNARRGGVEDFNKAAYRRATLPGMDVEGVGRGAVQDLRQGLGDAFDDIASRGSIRGPDQQFLQNMVNLGQMSQELPAQEAKAFKEIVQRELIERMGPNGQLNGENISQAIAGLRKEASSFSGSNDAWQRKLGSALNEAGNEVFELLGRSDPQLAAELAAAKKAYANFKTIQNAAGQVGAEDGIFTPAQLNRAARSADKTKDKRAFSEGDALLQDLAEVGKSIMPNKVPNSGTAAQLASNFLSLKGLAGLAGGGAASIPAMALYSKTGSRVANSLFDKLAEVESPNMLRLLMQSGVSQQRE